MAGTRAGRIKERRLYELGPNGRQKWGKLTDDDLDVIAGKKDELVGKIQERYGITREEAKKEVDSYNYADFSADSESEDLRRRKAS